MSMAIESVYRPVMHQHCSRGRRDLDIQPSSDAGRARRCVDRDNYDERAGPTEGGHFIPDDPITRSTVISITTRLGFTPGWR